MMREAIDKVTMKLHSYLASLFVLALWVTVFVSSPSYYAEGETLPVLDERCIVNILNGSAKVEKNGTFALSTPLPDGVPYRARVICDQDDQIFRGESALIDGVPDDITDTGEISFDSNHLIPVSLTLSVISKQLLPNAPSAQISVTGLLPDGSNSPLTASETGTVYRSSNPDIASVTENGLVTGLINGTAIISVRHEGAISSIEFEVLFPKDADGDGLEDEYEIANGLDPNNPNDAILDFDNDGLTNLEEFLLGTSPIFEDTDGDTISDFDEAQSGTDPVNPDSDSDGIVDGEELLRGTDPLNADTDNDGVNDGVEVEFGLDPNVFNETTTLTGRIIDESGVIVSNASVVAFDTFSALTDTSGTFEINFVPVVSGEIGVLARIIRDGVVLDGESSLETPVANGVTDFGSITVAEIVGRLSGAIYGPRGDLITGARVTAKFNNGNEERFTNADFQGRYQFDKLPGGAVEIIAQDPRIGLYGIATSSIDTESALTLDVTLSALGTIKGIAYQADGLTPVGADITIDLNRVGGGYTAQTLTNAFGEYSFEFVPLGEYNVDSISMDGNRGRTTTVLSGTTQVLDADIIYLGKGTVQGYVETSGGQRLSNVPISLYSNGIFAGVHTGTTDSIGEFVIENVFVGDFIVKSVDSVRKIAGNITNQIEYDTEVVDVVLTMQPTASLAGQIFEADGVTPVGGAKVAVSKSTFVFADASGNYRFDFVPLGSYTVTATTNDGDIGKSSVNLTTVDELVNQNIQLNGTGNVNVVVSNSKGLPVSSVQVKVETGFPYYKEYSGITDSQGQVVFNNVLAGSLSINAFDPIDRLGGSLSSNLFVGETVNIHMNLESAGDIFGVVYQPDGSTPAANITVEVHPGEIRTITAADGSYRFNMLALSKAPYEIKVFDSKGILRSRAEELQLSFDGEQIEQNFTITGNGSISGIAYNPGGTIAGGATVKLNSQIEGSKERITTTDSQGMYAFNGVPVGGFSLEASIISLRFAGTESAEIEYEGDQKIVDIIMQENQFPSSIKTVASLFDANNFEYAIQRDGTIQDGTLDVFAGDGDIFRGAGRLDIFRNNEVYPFSGFRNISLENNNREVVITGNNGSGLAVSRRIFVPADGYFSRYVESLSNPTSETITVDLRIDSHYRIATTVRTNSSGGSNTVQLPIGIISTSSGDNFLSTTGDADRWVVLDDDRDVDPFVERSVPAVGHVYDGIGAEVKASELEFLSGTTGQYNRMRNRWSNIVIEPGQAVSIMHFIIEQSDRSAAIASAQRLGDLPPESLEGLDENERNNILNFSVPSDGVSNIPALPSLLSSVEGMVYEGNGITPVANSMVSFQSDHPIFRRIQQRSTDQTGQYDFTGSVSNGNSSLPVPAFSYKVFAEHPQSLVDSDTIDGVVTEGSPSTLDILFTNTGQVTGTVRRFDGVVASFGKIELMGASLPRTLTAPIQEDGRYAFKGVPAGSYTLIASLPNPDGTGIAGSSIIDIVNGTEVIRDITLSEVGGVSGQVLTGGNEPVSNLLVKLVGGEFTREVRTDSGGFFRFLDTPLDSYTLSTFEPITKIKSESVVTVDNSNELFTQNLQLVSLGKVSVNAEFTDGQFAGGVNVQIKRLPAGEFYSAAGVTRTSDGQLIINGVPEGGFTIRVIHPLNSELSVVESGAISVHGEIVPVTVILPIDSSPEVILTNPSNGDIFFRGSTINVSAEVSDDYGIRRVEYLLDGEVVDVTDNNVGIYTQSITLNTIEGVNSAEIGIIVTDKAGNKVTQTASIVITEDDEAPSVEILAPSAGVSIIEGQLLNYSVSAQDNVAISSVDYLVNDTVVDTDTDHPFSGTFKIPDNYADAGAQNLTLVAKVFDTVGNTSESSVDVSVQPDLPPELSVVSSPDPGSSVIEGSSLFISANAQDDVKVERVELLIEGEVVQIRFSAPYQFEFNAPVLNSIVNPASIELRAFDSQEQMTTSTPVEVVVTKDEPPTIAMIEPVENTSIIEGTLITLSATAEDDLGVSKVEFYESNVLVGSDAVAPYSIDLRVASGAAGDLVSYTARAIDTLGQSTDDNRSIIRSDDVVPPTVQVTAPQDGAIVSVGPSDVAIVIDTSGSTGDSSGADVDGDGIYDNILKAEIFAAKELLNFLNPATTNVAIVDFSSSAILIRGLSNDFEDLNEALDQVLASGPSGGTNFDSAMHVATNELIGANSRSFATPVQLFLSDGSASHPEVEINRANDGGIIVNSFSVGSGANTTVLEAISQGTGGVSTPVPDASQIVELLPSVILFGIDALVAIADAQDDVAVKDVEFFVNSIDGLIQNQQIDLTTPYSLASLLPSIEENVDVTISAVAKDYGDNTVNSDPISVTLLPTENNPLLVKLVSDFATPGELISVSGQFLIADGSTQPSELNPNEVATTSVFYNGQEVIPDLIDKITVKFLLPIDAASGELYLVVDGVETNRIMINIDTDQDGLADEQEVELGTDPLIADSDGDGLSDGEEVNIHGTNPLETDSDSDGLNDSFELNNSLNPNDSSDAAADVDTDGLTNLQEFTIGTNPNDSDSDNDSLSDGDEVLVHLTNPLNTDSDGDLMNDNYEIANNLNPTVDDANLDADADGLSNFDESQRGTNPQLADTDNDGLSDFDEVTVHNTDPLDADTDNGGDPDGFEVTNNTDPLNSVDDISISLSTTLNDGLNYIWDIQRDGNINDGTSDAYDGGLRLTVNNNNFNSFSSALPEDSGRELTIGSELIDNLSVSRKIYVSDTYNFARFLEVIENTTSSDISATIRISSNFGSDGSTVVVGTSSGDLSFTNDDTYIVTDDSSDGGGDPTLIHLWGNSDSRLSASSVTRSGEILTIEYELSIPANGRSILMHLASQNSERSTALVNASSFESLPEYILTGMNIEEKGAVVNFEIGPDTDSDGLSDAREQLLGTDINHPDSDADGLPDGFEVNNGLDPLDVLDAGLDSDIDGLTNLYEYTIGTNLFNADSDEDGLEDGNEIIYGSDPLVTDSDGDGLVDGAEVNTHNSNPINTDTDSDGMSDGYEVANGLELTQDDATLDADSDGLTNIQEYQAGTDPQVIDTDSDGLSDSEELNIYNTDPLSIDTDGGGDSDGFEVQMGTDPLNGEDDPTVSFPFNLVDGEGYVWSITASGTLNDPIGNDSQTRVYDYAMNLRVGGIGYAGSYQDEVSSGLREDVGREVLIQNQVMQNIDVSRKVFVSDSHNFVRFLESFENTTNEAKEIFVEVFTNVGTNDLTTVVNTSSGTQMLDSNDSYVITDGGINSVSPRLLHMWGADSLSSRYSASLSGDILVITYNLTVPANGKSILMHFASQNTSREEAISNASTYGALPEYVLQGMTQVEKSYVVNFLIGSDTDSDGLSDLLETQLGTNPSNSDTDNDGLPDGFEYLEGFNPLDESDALEDEDGDGLTNIYEFTAGTELRSYDTDDDQLSDGDEINIYSTNPLSPDTDGDLLHDGFEVEYNFDPTIAGEAEIDSDSDTLTNLQEQELKTNPLLADTDGDGVDDALDTAPLNPDIQDLIDILIVEDSSENSAYLSKYTEVADQLGLTYTTWNKQTNGMPSRTLLSEHKLILWYNGELGYLNNSEEVSISNYLNGGGCFVLSSQDYHYANGLTNFMQSHLGLSSVDDDTLGNYSDEETGAVSIYGAGSLYSTLSTYNLAFDFSNYGDTITVATAESIYEVDGETVGSRLLTSDFSSVFLAFPLEAVSSPLERADIVNRIFDSCTFTHDLSVPGEPVPPEEPGEIEGPAFQINRIEEMDVRLVA